MNIRRAQNALDELARIASARMQWCADVDKISNISTGFLGPQGVSSNCALETAAMKLFDAHVEHLIDRHRRAVDAALDEA